MEVVVISSPSPVKGEVELINQLLYSGLNSFHLRKPGMPANEMAQLLDQIEPSFRDKIMVHSHLYLALEYGLKGIHFSRSNHERVEDFGPYGGSKSITIVNLPELIAINGSFDYALLDLATSFDVQAKYFEATLDKEMKMSFFNRTVRTSVLAYGESVRLNNVESILNLGFDGVALCNDLWEDYNRNQSVLKVLDKIKKVYACCQKV